MMKKNSILIILVLFVLSSQISLSQDIEKFVIQNTIAFHIRYAMNYELDLEGEYYLADNPNMLNRLFNCLNNLKYSCDSISQLNYPISGYSLYSFSISGFNCFVDDSLMTHFRIISQFPNDKYLVAVKIDKKEIKYLSGAFFKTKIAADFKLNIKEPESFYDYLYIKGYCYELQDINFKARNKTKLLFEAFSKVLGKFVRISVPINDQDNVNYLIYNSECTTSKK